MRRTQPRRRVCRKAAIETLEDRVVMSADPLAGLLGGAIDQLALADTFSEQAAAVLEQHGYADVAGQTPDFWLDPSIADEVGQHLYEIEQMLASANALTGVTQVRSDYGFIGSGQTVAVIDSGIAYDHYALGGGLGADFRVVGGWDFTEGDANPYDDGPSGSHGTHVSGIVGADSGTSSSSGVAPGVDLVGLRVFDDSGAGYFSWVEQALQWVHQNRNAFENPITAVNLSLGISWNSESPPSWAMLEDEFAQLVADGIFISVSAGNSFTSYGTTGLSYPAASPYVVPAMSVDDSGLLSYFSQRSERAIAAPGRYVVSTVPDYAGNHNGVTDDWASFSGTSMAAPYVAGASVLVREAMEFVGYTDITQQTIYDEMIATADQFYDSATQQYYNRLNVGAAIDALMPADDFGSSVAEAYNLGTIDGTAEVSGLIGRLDDVDYFAFTAGVTGTVSFTAATTQELAAAWTSVGGEAHLDGDTYTLEVVAGQTYSVGLSTTAGLGYYDLSITAESVFTYVDWGTVAQTRLDGVSNHGESWYRMEASRDGYLTAQALFSGGGDISLYLYDHGLEPLVSAAAAGDHDRVDALAQAGDEFFLCVVGNNDDIDFQLTNLVSLDGGVVNVTGTSQDDTIKYQGGNTQTITVNGIEYNFSTDAVSMIYVDGRAGNDSLTVELANVSAVRAEGVEHITDLDARAYSLDQDLGLHLQAGYYLNWAGLHEKWILGNTAWYIITPDGSLYRWTGHYDLVGNPLVGQLDAAYYADPTLLHDAQVTSVMRDQQTLDQIAHLGLHFYSSYYENWGGWHEKWVLSSAKQWYFVTPDGTLYKWSGESRLDGSTVVTNIGSKFNADPTLFEDASQFGSFSVSNAVQLDQELGLKLQGSYCLNWGYWGEKWVKGSGSDWYFITPSGGFYHWTGSRNLATSQIIAWLDASYFAKPSLLHEAFVASPASTGVQTAGLAGLENGPPNVVSSVIFDRVIDGGHAGRPRSRASLQDGTSRLIAGQESAGQSLVEWRTLISDRQLWESNTAIRPRDDAARLTAFEEVASSGIDDYDWLVETPFADDTASLHAAFSLLGRRLR